jgi:outer membrane protein OmpA-like peptidoglycan-associated protein
MRLIRRLVMRSVFLTLVLTIAWFMPDPAHSQERRQAEARQAVVFFPEHSTGLSELAQRVLDTQVALLDDDRALALIGEASDDEGEDAPGLSLARAEVVRDYLLARGVVPERLIVAARVGRDLSAVTAEIRPLKLLMN